VVWRSGGARFHLSDTGRHYPRADQQPYQRLPQLVLTADSPSGPNRLHSASRERMGEFLPPGQHHRPAPLTCSQAIACQLHNSYAYLHPQGRVRFTTWRLDNTSADESPNRGLPIYRVSTAGSPSTRGAGWRPGLHPDASNHALYVTFPTRTRTVCRCSTAPCRSSISTISSVRTALPAPIAWRRQSGNLRHHQPFLLPAAVVSRRA